MRKKIAKKTEQRHRHERERERERESASEGERKKYSSMKDFFIRMFSSIYRVFSSYTLPTYALNY